MAYFIYHHYLHSKLLQLHPHPYPLATGTQQVQENLAPINTKSDPEESDSDPEMNQVIHHSSYLHNWACAELNPHNPINQPTNSSSHPSAPPMVIIRTQGINITRHSGTHAAMTMGKPESLIKKSNYCISTLNYSKMLIHMYKWGGPYTNRWRRTQKSHLLCTINNTYSHGYETFCNLIFRDSILDSG